ncbi:MAG: SDR family oxidoreductase [Pseudomonadota bacterium]
MSTLYGQTAWVTGAGGGIGEAAAKELADAGAFVFVSGRREGELRRVVDEIRAANGDAEALPLDVVDAEAVEAAAKSIAEKRGGVDILVANAGVNIPNRHSATVTAGEFKQVVDINLTGVMNCVIPVMHQMRARGGGLIILVSSWAGRHASKVTGPAYNASKHGVVALSHTLNMEEGENNIRSCVIMPGEVNTPIMDRRPVPPGPEIRARMLQPEDLGRTVRFVAESPAHMCVNEILVSPTWNRTFIPPEKQADVEGR